MAAFLADQNFEDGVGHALIALGHDVRTARSFGLAATPDPVLLSFATAINRVVLTHDRDFIKLHKSGVSHAGIVFATADPDAVAFALRIHSAVNAVPSVVGQLIRIYLPS